MSEVFQPAPGQHAANDLVQLGVRGKNLAARWSASQVSRSSQSTVAA